MAKPHSALIGLAAGRGLAEPARPEALCRSALDHRMAGLVWAEVREGRVQLDGLWRERLAHYALRVRLSQAQLRSQLAAVSARLDSIGIEVATFKGVTAAERWYDSPSDRPCADIDLLLAPHHRERADDALAALDPNHPLLDTIARLAQRGLLPSVDAWLEDGTMVDLHFDLLKCEVPDRRPELLWSQTQRYPLGNGASVRVLQPELALLQLLINLNRDRFRYLSSFADVARLLAKEELDWDLFARLVHAEGLEVPVALSLETVCATLELPVPPHPPARGWRATMWRRLWPERVQLQGARGVNRWRNRQRLLPLLADGRAREGVRAWRRYLFPPRELTDLHFPETGGPYLWRNVAGRIRHVWSRRRRDARTAASAGLGRRDG